MSRTVIDESMVKPIAALELSIFIESGAVPRSVFEEATIGPDATPIYDYDTRKDEVLFYRVSVVKDDTKMGYADIAANSVFSHPLLKVCYRGTWEEERLRRQAISKFKKIGKGRRFDKPPRFVVYSYPKLAVQFLWRQKEVMMLDLVFWEPVPEERQRKRGELPGSFERWSLIKEATPELHQENQKSLRDRIWALESVCRPSKGFAAPSRGYAPTRKGTSKESHPPLRESAPASRGAPPAIENRILLLNPMEKQALLNPPPKSIGKSARSEKLVKSGGSIEPRSEDLDFVGPQERLPSLKTPQKVKFKKLQYCQRYKSDHFTDSDKEHACFEWRKQKETDWCAPASIQMVLDFYRYHYNQKTITGRLTLKSPEKPDGSVGGIERGDEEALLKAIGELTNEALKAHMHTDDKPRFWREFVTEIDKNRPVIRLEPGHYEAIAGYMENFDEFQKQLMIYDPLEKHPSWMQYCPKKKDCKDCKGLNRCIVVFSARLRK
jgi:hypothetical protein